MKLEDIDESVAFLLTKKNGKPFIGQVVERIERFCRTFADGTDPELLVDAVLNDFIFEKGQFGIYVYATKGRVQGHVLVAAMSPPWSKKIDCHVIQHWLDRDLRVSIPVQRKIFESIVRWASDNGMEKINAIPTNEKIARRLRMFYDFKDGGYQLSYDVAEGLSNGKKRWGWGEDNNHGKRSA